MIILVDRNNLIQFHGNYAEVVCNGIQVDNFVIAIPTTQTDNLPYKILEVEELPKDYVPGKYAFVNNTIQLNNLYELNYASPELKRIAELEQETIELQYQLLTGEVM